MINFKECLVADKLLRIETGKLANQADSSVTVRYGDTIVLVTTCVGADPDCKVDRPLIAPTFIQRLEQ
jgi:polyribonucleotide nucleotidyltransferase